MRRGASKNISMTTTDERGASMGGSMLYSDAKWLAKLCARIELQASQAFPKDQFHLRITTAEVKRAKRIAQTLRWHLQHVALSGRAGTHLDIDPEPVPRGNPQPQPENGSK